MFKNIISEDEMEKINPAIFLAILIGLSINDVNLVRSSLIKVNKEVNEDYSKALFAIINKDPTQETSLKLLLKKLNINSKLGLNLLELVNGKRNGELKFNAALTI
jgi:hypothetical protein